MTCSRGFGSAALLLASFALAQDEPPRSLIGQGGFEGTLEGWQVDHGSVALDAEQAAEGTGCVRLTNGAALTTPLIPYEQQFVRVTFRMMTQDVRRGPNPWNAAGGQIAWYDARQQAMGHQDLGLTLGTTAWTAHEAIYFREAKEQVAFFRVRLMVWDAEGVAWFDEVSVEAVAPPEAYRKVPLLEAVENDPPRFWPLPELQPVTGPVDLGPIEVSFTGQQDFFIRPADARAPTIGRLDVALATSEAPGFREQGLEAAAGYYYRYRSRAESGQGYPTLEMHDEVFRGSPIVSHFMRVYLANETQLTGLQASFALPPDLTELAYFTGNTLQHISADGARVTYRFGETTKPFVIVHDAQDTSGIVIYHPTPPEVRRWHIEDYVIESRPDLRCGVLKQADGTRVLLWSLEGVTAGAGGCEHSLDFPMYLMPYAGSLKQALIEFQVGETDLTADLPPVPAPGGYWAEWTGVDPAMRPLRMARYHPREFASWIPGTLGGCYGHADGHMWGVMTRQMKWIRVDPLAERALLRDDAIRMLHFFLERANDHGAPPDMSMWREIAAGLPDPEQYFAHVFCQYWEYRLGEFRRLMESPHLTDAEKDLVYEQLQRARPVFDPDAPGSWTRRLPEGGWWFEYMDLPLWPESPFIINTHATSLGVAGQFRLLALDRNAADDADWWGEVFRQGVDGLLYALGQDWMWHVDGHDPNELRYGKTEGGPASYHGYMVTAWMPEVIRSAVALDSYRVDELVGYYRRMTQARFLATDTEAQQAAKAFLASIGRGGE